MTNGELIELLGLFPEECEVNILVVGKDWDGCDEPYRNPASRVLGIANSVLISPEDADEHLPGIVRQEELRLEYAEFISGEPE